MKRSSLCFSTLTLLCMTMLVSRPVAAQIGQYVGTGTFGRVKVGTTVKGSAFFQGGAWYGQNAVLTTETLTGPDAADFTVTPNYAGTTMPYGTTWPFTMTFTPSHPGKETMYLNWSFTPVPPFGSYYSTYTGFGVVPEAGTAFTFGLLMCGGFAVMRRRGRMSRAAVQ